MLCFGARILFSWILPPALAIALSSVIWLFCSIALSWPRIPAPPTASTDSKGFFYSPIEDAMYPLPVASMVPLFTNLFSD